MILRLRLGVGHAGQRGEVAVGRFHVDEVHLELATERVLDLVGLAGAHQAGVDEDTRELVADRLVHQGRRHGGIHATAQRAQHPVASHLGLHGRHLLLDDGDMRPPREAAAHVDEEVVEDLAAPVGVHDLGVELQAEEATLGVVHGCHRSAGARGARGEALGHGGDGVAVAHPHARCRRPVRAQG